MKDKLNLTLLTDFYEFTMAGGFFEEGVGDTIAYFDMFFRTIPDNGGFAIRFIAKSSHNGAESCRWQTSMVCNGG